MEDDGGHWECKKRREKRGMMGEARRLLNGRDVVCAPFALDYDELFCAVMLTRWRGAGMGGKKVFSSSRWFFGW